MFLFLCDPFYLFKFNYIDVLSWNGCMYLII